MASPATLFQVLETRAARDGARLYLSVADVTQSYDQTLNGARRAAAAIDDNQWAGRHTPLAVNTSDPARLAQLIWACAYLDVSLAFMPDCQVGAEMYALMKTVGSRTLITDQPALLGEPWAVQPDRMDQLPHGAALEPAPQEAGTECGFILQTSGTAGEPRWVRCSYAQCLHALNGMETAGALDHTRRQVAFISPPLFHSYGLSSLLEYSWGGSTVVLPASDKGLGSVGELITSGPYAGVTAIEGVPYFFGQLVKLVSRLHLDSLQHCGVGGGALDPTLASTLGAKWPGLNFAVRYGMTETPSAVTHKLLPADAPDLSSSGTATAAYEVTIVDDQGQVLPADHQGEIVVRSDCVGTYLGQPRQSSLRTGDIGRLSATGELRVVGRRSAFLKNRGFRISPQRVEAVVTSLAGVQECRVRMADGRLLAEVVGDSLPPPRDMIAELGRHLPPYCVPDRIVQVKALPRTRSGKLKRH